MGNISSVINAFYNMPMVNLTMLDRWWMIRLPIWEKTRAL